MPLTATAPSHSPTRPLPRSVAAPVAGLGAALVLAGDAYHLFVLDDRPTQAGSAAYTAHGLGIMLGLLLLLLAALSVARASRTSGAGLPLLVVGTALVVGDVWAEVVVLPGVVTGKAAPLLGEDIGGTHLALVVAAYALFALGWVLYALSMRAVVGAAAWLLVVGGVIAFLPVGGSYVALALGAAVVVGLAARQEEGRQEEEG